MNKPKIIVFQTSVYALETCGDMMVKMGLIRGVDFVLISDTNKLEDRLTPGERQLFITGSFGGDHKGVPEMVFQARGVNHELVCVGYISSQISAPLDMLIVKDQDMWGNFRFAVRSFLDGNLNRTLTQWEINRASKS